MSLAVLARKTKAKYTKSKNTDINATQKVYIKEDHQIKVTTIRNSRQIPIQYKSNFVSKDNSPFNATTQYFYDKTDDSFNIQVEGIFEKNTFDYIYILNEQTKAYRKYYTSNSQLDIISHGKTFKTTWKWYTSNNNSNIWKSRYSSENENSFWSLSSEKYIKVYYNGTNSKYVVVKNNSNKNCSFSYRTYLNRKSNGAYRPSGRPCDCKSLNEAESSKPYNTWKKNKNISSSEIVMHKKQSTIMRSRGLEIRKPRYLGDKLISNKLDSKPVCSWYNPETCKYETVQNNNPFNSVNCTLSNGIKIKGRLSYNRINQNWCNTTKSIEKAVNSSEQILIKKQQAFKCINNDFCNNNCIYCDSPPYGKNNQINLDVMVNELNDPSNNGRGIYEIILLNGPDKLCRCNQEFYLDVSKLTTETYYLTLGYPSIKNGAFVEDPLRQGYYNYSQTGFETYLNNNPTLNVIKFIGGGLNKVKFKLPSYICNNTSNNNKFLYLINTTRGTPIDTFNEVNFGFIPLYFTLICRDRKKCKLLQNRYCYTRPNNSSAKKICDDKPIIGEKADFNFKCFEKVDGENYISAGQPNSWLNTNPTEQGFQITFQPRYYCGFFNDPKINCPGVTTGLWHGFASFRNLDSQGGAFQFDSYWRPQFTTFTRESNSPDFKLKLSPGQVPGVPTTDPFWYDNGNKNKIMTTYTILSLNNSYSAILGNIAQIPTNGTEFGNPTLGKPFNKNVIFTGKVYEYTLNPLYSVHVFVKKIKPDITSGRPSYVDEFNNTYTYKLSNLSKNTVFTIGVPDSFFPTWTNNGINYGSGEKYFIWVGFMIEGPWLNPSEKDSFGHITVGLCK
jgi:hypothetical protein